MGLWSKVVHSIGNSMPFGTEPFRQELWAVGSVRGSDVGPVKVGGCMAVMSVILQELWIRGLLPPTQGKLKDNFPPLHRNFCSHSPLRVKTTTDRQTQTNTHARTHTLLIQRGWIKCGRHISVEWIQLCNWVDIHFTLPFLISHTHITCTHMHTILTPNTHFQTRHMRCCYCLLSILQPSHFTTAYSICT